MSDWRKDFEHLDVNKCECGHNAHWHSAVNGCERCECKRLKVAQPEPPAITLDARMECRNCKWVSPPPTLAAKKHATHTKED